jgi:solute carrier family 5 (sodium-coupled monocarboxylate transporter), member 8/12
LIGVNNINLKWGDWGAVALYFGITFYIGWRAKAQQSNPADYFLNGRRTHWIIAGVSLYATLFSTVSFVGMPGEAYKNGVLYGLYSLGYFLFTPLAMWLLLRFFYDTRSFTAYEYLERRYDGRVRTLGALVFLGARLLSGATVLYATAKIFETLVGWNASATILVVGTFTIYYCYIGGMRAIVLTDVLQSGVMLIGLGCILLKLLSLVGFDVGAVWRHAADQGKTFGRVLEPGFYTFDPHVRFTFWVWLAMSVLAPLNNYGTDQLVVQRLLCTNSYASAKRAIWLKTAAALPLSALFYFVGLLLLYYYQRVAAPPPKVAADLVLGYFINQHLPAPVPGLVLAALMAALMSAISSTIGSLATVGTVDLAQRFRRTPLSHEHMLALGKWFTLGGGALTMSLALALVYAGQHTETTVVEVANVCNSLWGVLLVVVLAGIFTNWATARAACLALLIGICINATLPWFLYYGTPPAQRISFAWVGIPGMAVAALVVLIGSRLDSRKTRELAGLTWKTSPRIGSGNGATTGGPSPQPFVLTPCGPTER